MATRCKTCAEEILNSDFVKCHGHCADAFHSKCVALSKTLLNALGSNPNIRWYCHNCNESSSIANSLTEMKESFGQMSGSLSQDLGVLIRSMSELTNCFTKSISSSQAKPRECQSTDVVNRALHAKSMVSFPSTAVRAVKRRRGQSSQPNPAKIHCNDDRLSSLKATTAARIESSDKRCIVVSNIAPDTDVHVLTKFLCSKLMATVDQVKVASIVPQSIKRDDLKFNQFKVSIPTEMYDTAMSPSIWPYGVKLRDFVFKQYKDKPSRTRPPPVDKDLFRILDDVDQSLQSSVDNTEKNSGDGNGYVSEVVGGNSEVAPQSLVHSDFPNPPPVEAMQ